MVAQDNILSTNGYTVRNIFKRSRTHVSGQWRFQRLPDQSHILLPPHRVFQILQNWLHLFPIMNGRFHCPEGVWVDPKWHRTGGPVRAELTVQSKHSVHFLLRIKNATFQLDRLKTKLTAHRFCLCHDTRRVEGGGLPGSGPALGGGVGSESQFAPRPFVFVKKIS